MIARCLVLVALLAADAAVASDRWEWRRSDTALQATYTVLHLVDWSQSIDIARRAPAHPLWQEGNPILGSFPSERRVHAYMAATLVGHALIARALPRPYRSVWQCITIGLETSAVGMNFSSGVRLAF